MTPKLSRPVRVLLVGAAALLVVDAASWGLFGHPQLNRQIPALARADLRLWRDGISKDGRSLPAAAVLEPEQARSLGPSVTAALGRVFREFDMPLYVPPNLPAGIAWDKPTKCTNCVAFSYDFRSYTPFHTEVVTGYWQGGSVFFCFRHNLVWGLVNWIRTSDRFGGND